MTELDIDIFSDDVRREPFEAYRRLRDAGPICRLPGYDLYAMGRHADIKAALGNWQDYASGDGVALNALTNDWMTGTTLASDPPVHKNLRDILARPFRPQKLAALRQRLADLADAKVRLLVGTGPVEAMRELAQLLPLAVISELVGLPEEGREQMLDWAAAAFNCMAPAELELTQSAFPVMAGMMTYINDPSLPERMRPGTWAAELWECTRTGEITEESFRSIVQGYVSPSLDTTIFAIGNLLWLLSNNPDQWSTLRKEPALVQRSVNEALRMESPALGFSRVTRRELTIGGEIVPAGARIVTVLPSGNRDERRYADPDRFDVRRDSSDHLAFGGGIHRCVGGTLAMLEITTVLEALVRHVSNIECTSAVRADNAVLRGFAELKITLH